MQVIHHEPPVAALIARINQYALFTVAHDRYRLTCLKKRDGTYMFPIFTDDGYAMYTRYNTKLFAEMKALALETIGK